jgi:hypothetical protein
LKAGTIEFGDGAIGCMVRDLSTGGAALDVTASVGVPEHFTLFADGSHKSCRIIWRNQKRIGMEFD